MSSGTGAYVTFYNNGAPNETLTVAVGHHVCMQGNVNHLAVNVAAGANSGEIYVEASESISCIDTQSQFSFTLSDGNGNFADLAFDLGSDKFTTQLLYNTCPGRVSVSMGTKNSSHAIGISVAPYSPTQAMLTAAAFASGPQLQASISLPQINEGPFTFSEATLAGISNLTCTYFAVSGSAETGAVINTAFYAAELDTSCTVRVSPLPGVGSGIAIQNAGLGVTLSAAATRTPSQTNPYAYDCSMAITAKQIVLLSGSASVHNLPLTDGMATDLFELAQALVNGPLQALLLSEINQLLPGNTNNQQGIGA